LENKQTANRKGDHIEMTFDAQVVQRDIRFYYEPLLSGHPSAEKEFPDLKANGFEIAGKKLRLPIWVSSMTGGAKMAGQINNNLALACKEFGMGMGLGSCRIILNDNTHLKDFQIRNQIGDESPLFANLGIAQIEFLLKQGKQRKILELIDKLDADGLIVHINPLQEWLQPEGDQIENPPLETIKQLLEVFDKPVIVKEVGQGMGPASLKELFKLPLEAIDFGAHGGTNFAQLELLRSDETTRNYFENIVHIGHNAEEMAGYTNCILEELGNKTRCKKVIVSGGVKDFLDGYYFINKVQCPAIYGQASSLLKYAMSSYEALKRHLELQRAGLQMAHAFLKVR
jgi:isopentenyl-diphosphate delta-isomerase